MMGGRLLLTSALFALAACLNAAGGAASADQAYRRGLAALEAGQPRTARIEFMNAIKASPDNGAIRVAQALTYLKLGDGVAAESELIRARQLGIAPAETSHLVAHALLLQGQNERAIEEAAKAGAAYASYAARMRGRAFMNLGDEAAASAAFEQALAANRGDGEAWADLARLRRAGGDLAGALAAADQAVKREPRNVEALTLRGELTRGQYGLSAAIPWFDQALAIDPANVAALGERALTLGDLGRMKAMLADARKILSVSNSPIAYYLQAMLAARGKNFELARSLFERTRGALDDQPSAMLLAGAIEYETQRFDQAVRHLGRLVELQPDNVKARRLLGAAYWGKGDAAATIETLMPLADRPDADAYSLTLIAEAFEKQGDKERAASYFARAAQPTQGPAAIFGPALGGEELASLRDAAENAPGDAGLQVELIRALLASGLGDEALQRARRLQAANPGTPEVHILAGDALGIGGDFTAAANEYRRAANLSFSEPVAMRLVEALRAAGDAKGAAEVLQLFLQQNPQSIPAQLLAARSLMQAKDWDGAIGIYENVRKRIGSRDATILNNLAWAYAQKGDFDAALPLAKRAWQLDPRNPATADTLGWLLFRSGKDKARGLALLEQAARGAPSDADIRRHLGVARGR